MLDTPNMIPYAVVNDRGQIVRTGMTDRMMLNAQAEAGQKAFDISGLGIGDDTHYRKNSEWKRYPIRVSKALRFDYENEVWFDPRSAEEIRHEFQQVYFNAVNAVNTRIGKLRTMYITDIPGQSEIYAMKEQEAIAYLAHPNPMLFNYPNISYEVGSTGDSPYQVAQVFLNKAQVTREGLQRLENIRQDFLVFLAQAKTEIEINKILQKFQDIR